MGFGSIVQRICFYLMNPEQDFPMASDEGQMMELEKCVRQLLTLGKGSEIYSPNIRGSQRRESVRKLQDKC